jgi:serine/threonine protein kinase
MLEFNQAGRYTDLWALGCMLYEFLVGRTPFVAESGHKMFENILDRKLSFPKGLDKNAADLINKLLASNPTERIGYSSYQELKDHPFFEGIDFEDLARGKL